MNAAKAERAATLEAPDDIDAINRLYRERRWSDGLPIVPPTAERVARMLSRTRRGRNEIVTRVPPGYGAATVERIALELARGGMSKSDVKQELWEKSKMPARSLARKELDRARDSRTLELGEIEADTLLPISQRPEEIMFIVAGGPGTHSVYVPCFGNSRAITRTIAE